MSAPETTRCPEWPRCGCGGQPCKREGEHQPAAAKSGTTDDLPHPMQPIGWDRYGVIRFKRNAIVDALLEDCRSRGGLDLNKIAIAAARGQFSNEDQVQLAQLIGYSVSGFGDLSYVPEEIVQQADAEAERIASERR